MNKFYVVWNPSRQSPVMQHDTFEAAAGEAQRLAFKKPGELFYVLQPCGLAEGKATVSWTTDIDGEAE